MASRMREVIVPLYLALVQQLRGWGLQRGGHQSLVSRTAGMWWSHDLRRGVEVALADVVY